MIKNILITGLVLGKETEMCSCSNVNTGWLFDRPSDLLWADKIIVTNNEWEVITRGGDGKAFGMASKLVLERLQAEGMVKIIPDAVIHQLRAESILKTIENDLKYIEDLYTESEDECDPIMTMGKFHFCVPSLWTLYASIELSRDFNANFSLDQNELAYLMELIPRKYEWEIHTGKKKAIEEVLSLYLPSVELGHAYLIDSERGRCSKCNHYEKCSVSYLAEIEKQVEAIIKLRQYDEIRMTCEVMDKICEKNMAQGHVLTGEELWDDLQEEARKTEKIVRSKLPKIKMWRKLSAFATIGLGAASFLHPAIGVGAAIPAVAGELLAAYEEKQIKETSWVNFVNSPEAVLGKQ